jgi:hypothetical protein
MSLPIRAFLILIKVIIESMTENQAEDVPQADSPFGLSSSSNSSEEQDLQNRRSSYADNRKS